MASADSTRAHGRRRHLPSWEALLLGTVIAANTAVVLSVQYFPYTDATNHLARYVLLAQIWGGEPPPFPAEFRFVPTAYLGMDAVGAILVGLMPPLAAQRVLSLVAVNLTPVAMYLLLRAKAPAARGWALIGALLAFNWFFLIGFVSYAVGVGLAMLWIAGWWRYRTHPSVAAGLLLAVGALALYFVHLSAAAVALIVAWTDTALHLGSGELQVRRVIRDRRTWATVAVTLAVGSAWLAAKAYAPGDPLPAYTTEMRGALSKVTHLFAPFYSFSPAQAALMAGTYFASVLLFGGWHRFHWKRDSLALATAGLFIAYLVFPATFMGAEDVDVRFLLPGLLLIFCCPARESPPRRVFLLVPFLGCLVHAAVIGHRAVVIDRELADMAAVLDLLPARSNVLPLVSDQRRHGRIPAYRHFAHWHTIKRQGRAPNLFSGNGNGQQLLHFWVPDRLYHPGDDWGTRQYSPLAWDRILAQYEFIVDAGADPRASALIMEHAEAVARKGEVTLYRVLPGGVSKSLPP